MKIQTLKFLIVFLSLIIFGVASDARADTIINRPLYVGLTSGLQGFWSFDGSDTANDIITDISGNSKNGKLTNGAVRVVGKIGQGVKFDGVDDYIDLTSTMGDKSYSDTTFSVWYKSNTSTVVDDQYFFIHLNGGSTNGIIFSATDDASHTDQLRLVVLKDSVTSNYYGTSDIVDRRWHHLVIVRNSTSILAYVDGVLESTTADVDAGAAVAVTGSTVAYIGDHPANTEQVDGVLDDFRVYNRALSNDEIKRLYRLGGTFIINKPIVNDSLKNGLNGYWSFDGDDLTSNSAIDRSGQKNNGTRSGTIPKVGRISQSLGFNGSTDVVTLSSAPMPKTTGSVSFWMKANQIRAMAAYYESSGTTINEFNGFGNGTDTYETTWGIGAVSNKLAFQYQDGPVSVTFEETTPVVGTWYHVVGTWDRNTGISQFYVNGAIASTSTIFTPTSNNTASVYQFGKVGDGAAARYWDGQIDDFRVYNRVLTRDEVLRLFKLGETFTINKPIVADSLSRGLVGYWSFDPSDIYGTTLYDRSGQGVNGTITAAPSKVIGKFGQAFQFNGSSQYIDMGVGRLDFGRTDSFTLSAWVWRNSENTYDDIMGNIIGPLTYQGYRYIIFSNADPNANALCVDLINHNGADVWSRVCSPNSSVSPRKWTHLAFTYDGAVTGIAGVQIYIDGIQQSKQTVHDTLAGGDFKQSFYSWGIGLMPAEATHYMDGKIDEARVYNRVLSPDEIKRLYNLGK